MKADIKDLGLAGVLTDQEGYELPPNGLTTANNVRMWRGWAERIGGHAQVFSSTSVIPYAIFPFSTATTNYIIHCGLTAVYADDGSTRTDISPAAAPAGNASTRMTGGTLHGLFVLNNGVDSPWAWNGNTASDLTLLTGYGWSANWRAKALRPFKDYLVAINLTKSGTNYPHMVKWSHVADPGAIPTSWDETDPSKDAGEQDLAETPDPLVDALPLGDQLIVYGERSAYSMSYIGAPYIWRFQRLPGDHGLMNPACVVQIPAGHVCLTQGDVILHAGGQPQSIIDGKNRDWLLSRINSTAYKAAFVTHNPDKSEVWVCLPATGSLYCTQALVWNYADNVFSTRDLPNVTHATPGVVAYTTSSITFATVSGTFASITGTFADYDSYAASKTRLFLASYDSKIFVADESNLAAGSTFTASIERTGIDLGAPEVRKLVRQAWPRIDGDTGATVSVQLGAADDPQSSPTWQTAQTFTVGTSNKIDSLAAGRYLAFRVTSTSSQPWRIRSLSLDYAPLGRY